MCGCRWWCLQIQYLGPGRVVGKKMGMETLSFLLGCLEVEGEVRDGSKAKGRC